MRVEICLCCTHFMFSIAFYIKFKLISLVPNSLPTSTLTILLQVSCFLTILISLKFLKFSRLSSFRIFVHAAPSSGTVFLFANIQFSGLFF